MTELAQPRYRRRVPCRMNLGEQQYAGVVLNLSGSGLFIQTSASARPGDSVELTLGGTIPITGEVVWQRKVAPMLRSLAAGGVGIRIRNASEAYYSLLAKAATPDAGVPTAAASGPVVPASKTAAPRSWVLPKRQARKSIVVPMSSGRSFCARLKASHGPRSRTVEIQALNTLEAERKALLEAGPGWFLLDLEERLERDS